MTAPEIATPRSDGRWFGLCVAVSALAVIGALITAAPGAQAAPAVAQFFPVTGVGANNQIAPDTNGNIWVTLDTGPKDFAKIAPDGTVTEFDAPAVSNPIGIASDNAGNMWVTQIGKVAKFDPANPAAAVASNIAEITDPRGITAGPDASMWTASNDKVIKIPMGDPLSYTAFSGSGVTGARAISAGADGNLWVADFAGAQIVRVTPAGVGTTFPVGGGPQGVAASSGNQIGYTNAGATPHEVGRIDPPSTTPNKTTVPLADPFGMAFGADGAYWIANFAEHTVGRLTTTGSYTTVSVGPGTPGPRQLCKGPDGTIWVTLDNDNKVAKITGVEPPPSPSTSSASPSNSTSPTTTPTPTPTPTPTVAPRRSTAKVAAVKRASKLRVKVRPLLTGAQQWRFRVQVRKAGKWRTLLGTRTTAGARRIRVVDLPKGRYRVKVSARTGFLGSISNTARLRR